ncbi:L-serine ammonia-lyase, iron-sulfur-dependent, subunit beta [Candidatus Peregrinibacteria bacterium]|nr:L-serine ammonia-lyase, iron-sulfur-dependent, subunit beta [Candidatus Peregrinibacteria bacterium]
MPNLSIFDIAGPIMVGPSSSHTAGACKIGQFARALFHATPKKVTFYLHGSFGEVYKGHATDRALLAGIMKFMTSDPRIKDSFAIAKKKGLAYKFIKKNLGSRYHPNTVRVVLENRDRKMSVIGCSIGGGMIEIVKIDNFNVYIKGRAGKYLSLVICHDKNPNLLPEIIAKIRKLGINIVETVQTNYKDKTLTVLSVEGKRITLQEVIDLENTTPGINFIRSLSKLQSQ